MENVTVFSGGRNIISAWVRALENLMVVVLLLTAAASSNNNNKKHTSVRLERRIAMPPIQV